MSWDTFSYQCCLTVSVSACSLATAPGATGPAAPHGPPTAAPPDSPADGEHGGGLEPLPPAPLQGEVGVQFAALACLDCPCSQVKRFRDFIACLPANLARCILVCLPPRELLTASHVCHTWMGQCSSDLVWRVKCRQGQLGGPSAPHLTCTSLPAAYCSRLCPPGAALPLSPQNGAWRDLFMRELVLRKNWRSGTCWTWALPGHTRSVVSVSVRGSVLASGSLDRSIRLWDLRSGQVLRTLRGHQVGLWQALCNP